MATPEQILAIKMNSGVPVRKLAEQVGLSKSRVHQLQRQVAEISTDGKMIVITRRVAL